MIYIYLAGPIAGCSKTEAKDWRQYVCDKFPETIIGVSPLRCEPLIGRKYKLNYDDPRFGTPRAIRGKNFWDVRRCDILLANLPKVINARRPSYGTISELAWAHVWQKPTILVTDDSYVSDHPLVGGCADWVLADLDSAIETVIGLCEVYT